MRNHGCESGRFEAEFGLIVARLFVRNLWTVIGKSAIDARPHLNNVHLNLKIVVQRRRWLAGPGWGVSFRHRAPAGAQCAPYRMSMESPAVSAPSLCRKAAGRRVPALASPFRVWCIASARKEELQRPVRVAGPPKGAAANRTAG